MSHFQIVVGHGQANPQDVLSLTMRVADAASEMGMAVVSVKSSHSPGSASRYLTLRDTRQRAWLIRVSNHPRPRSSRHERPHLDLVSLDGLSGFTEVVVFLRQIEAGQVAWRDCWTPATSRKIRRLARRAGK